MIKKAAEVLRRPQKPTPAAALMFFAALLCAAYLSADARYGQYRVWQSYPESFFAGETPMMTTLDAYKFTRHAKEYRSGTLDTKSADPMVFHPDGSGYQDPVPLLSVMLDKYSSLSGKDFYNAAADMVPIMSSLFIIPLAFYFMLAGYPAAGLIGGLIGTFAPMYYGRTSIGRLDTDGMNVFFMITASLFLFMASKTKKPWKIYLYSGLAGVTVNLFYWWYQHGLFNIIYAGLLALCLFLSKARIRDILISLAVFVLLSNPLYMYEALSQLYRVVDVYLFPLKDGASTVFPNVYDTIGEAQRNTLTETLSAVVRKPVLAAAGLFLFAVFAITHIRAALPLAPLILMGAMAFVSSGRFSMFLGPLAGIGYGWAATAAGSYLAETAKKYKETKEKPLFTRTLIYGALFAAACAFTGAAITVTAKAAFASVPGPSINPNIYRMFQDMSQKLSANSAIYTWWDYGLAIADVTGFPVFQSGTSQDTPKTWIMAKSLTGTQKDLYNTASYLGTYGIGELGYMADEKKPLGEIASYIENYGEGPSSDADYVLFTQDMIGKFYPMSYLASWDPATEKSDPKYFATLQCTQIKGTVLTCGTMTIDLASGIINGGKGALSRVIFTEKGQETRRAEYGFSGGAVLILNTENQTLTGAWAFAPELADTAFVELYFLNRPDPEYFETAMDSYPYGRLFRLKTKAADAE